jgi:hypothetical protein
MVDPYSGTIVDGVSNRGLPSAKSCDTRLEDLQRVARVTILCEKWPQTAPVLSQHRLEAQYYPWDCLISGNSVAMHTLQADFWPL